MQIISQIQMAKCLVLDKRYGQFVKTQEQFKNRLGIEIEPFIAGDGKILPIYHHIDSQDRPPFFPSRSILYPTWYERPNAYNAYKCHVKMLEEAKNRNVENILMVEDDTFLEDDFEEIVSKTDEFFDNNNWDMVYFGGYHHNNTTEVLPNLLRLHESGGWHCVLIKTYMIENILSRGPIGPLDWQTEHFILKHCNAYCIYPCVASQADGYSFVEGGNLSKPSRYNR